MLDSGVMRRIRTIFLHQQPAVSIADAALLLGWSSPEVNRAIAAGEIETTTTSSGRLVRTEEMVAKALEVWPLDTIEAALGKDAPLVLPPLLRTREVVTYLPGYQVRMLEHFARKQQTTIAHLIAEQLEGSANATPEELSASIPGFGEAIQWPYVEPERVGSRRGQDRACRWSNVELREPVRCAQSQYPSR